MKDVKHVQQFNESHHLNRDVMPVECGSAAKVLDEFLQPTAAFPSEGLGAVPMEKKHPGDLAVRAIKGMAAKHVLLAVVAEATAINRGRGRLRPSQTGAAPDGALPLCRWQRTCRGPACCARPAEA